MESSEVVLELIIQFQVKYRHMYEIHKLTKEMGDSLSRNDQVSVDMLIEMRQEEIEHVNRGNKTINILEQALNPDDAQLYRELIKQSDNGYSANTFEEKKLVELSSGIRNVLEQTKIIDGVISKRLAGKDSFYSVSI